LQWDGFLNSSGAFLGDPESHGLDLHLTGQRIVYFGMAWDGLF